MDTTLLCPLIEGGSDRCLAQGASQTFLAACIWAAWCNHSTTLWGVGGQVSNDFVTLRPALEA